mmetsp:Transcript_19408/g.41794  ORF Transcript_19408/g.41794 Transcript_19408/m.41794 type:complete len:167 (-) Transcript_19408:49-549(-)
MGGSSSKASAPKEDKWATFRNNIRSNVEDEIARKMMMQREVQMAVNIARARDTLNYFGSAWLTLVTGSSLAHAMGRPVPPVVGVPIVIGALALGNIADMAYGNKLNRVVNEAEYIMEFERGRFVPPKQATFSKFYTEEEKKVYYDESTPVGEVLPGSLIFGRPKSS